MIRSFFRRVQIIYKLEKKINSSIVCFTIISSLTLLHHPLVGKTSVVQFNRFFLAARVEGVESEDL